MTKTGNSDEKRFRIPWEARQAWKPRKRPISMSARGRALGKCCRLVTQFKTTDLAKVAQTLQAMIDAGETADKKRKRAPRKKTVRRRAVGK